MRKTFIVDSMGRETISLIKRELGDDAVIISSQTIETGGICGLFGTRQIEIVASNDPDESFNGAGNGFSRTSSPDSANRYTSGRYRGAMSNVSGAHVADHYDTARVKDRLELSSGLSGNGSLIKRPVARTKPLIPGTGGNGAFNVDSIERAASIIARSRTPDPWETETVPAGFSSNDNLRKANTHSRKVEHSSDNSVISGDASNLSSQYSYVLKAFEKEMAMLRNQVQVLSARLNPEDAAKEKMPETPCEKLRYHLEKHRVQNLIIDEILEKLAPYSEDSKKFMSELHQLITARIPVREDKISSPGDGQRVISLIGATGSGKTTTIAKLAAHFHLANNLSVAFLTIDDNRPDAIEQLESFSNILDMPAKLVLGVRDLQEEISRNSDKDVVLIDTAGRNHRNAEVLKDISRYLSRIKNLEALLSISATTRPGEIADAMKNFSSLNYSGLIITKVDESADLCGLLNILGPDCPPISYLTNGQRIPGDIRIARASNIADLIISKFRL